MKTSKSLYTKAEEAEVNGLLSQPFSDKVEKRMLELQTKYCEREVRIITGHESLSDKAHGFTAKNFPWLPLTNNTAGVA
jgi:hypothetical protein